MRQDEIEIGAKVATLCQSNLLPFASAIEWSIIWKKIADLYLKLNYEVRVLSVLSGGCLFECHLV